MAWTSDLGTLLSALGRNLGAKLFAVVAAFVLWFFVNAGQRATEIVSFPLDFRNIPEQTVLTNSDRVDTISVKLNGPGPLLASLDARRVPVVVDLRGVKVGEDLRLKVRDEMIRLPRGVRVLEIEPSRIPVRLDALRRAAVPVAAVRVGDPHEGYRIAGITTTPARVGVTGPASLIDRLETIETEPVDVAGMQGPTQRTVALVRPDELVSIRPERVLVDIDVTRIITSREFKRLAVDVRNLNRAFQLRPTRVNLTIRGPDRVVRNLDLGDGSVFVDGAPYGPGHHTVQLEVTLPPDVEVVKWDPPNVRLEILGERNGARR